MFKMDKTMRMVAWICRKFGKENALKIAFNIIEAVNHPTDTVVFKDQFKEEHPNYREFHIDPKAPVKDSKKKKKRRITR